MPLNTLYFVLSIPPFTCMSFQICSGRNDIEVDGRKISGSAFKHASGHSMHHGTLLASVNMGVMSSVLTPNSLKLQSKGVASVAARVVNLAELNPLVDHQALTSALIHSFQQNFFCSSSAITCLDQSAMMSISEVAIEAQKLQVGMYFSNFSDSLSALCHRNVSGCMDRHPSSHRSTKSGLIGALSRSVTQNLCEL